VIDCADLQPDAAVAEAEYTRLLGYPPGWTLDGRAAELAGQARAWYARHGRPWVYVRQADTVDLSASSVRIDGVVFTAARLRTMLQRTDAHQVMLIAVGAGPELEAHAAGLWRDEKPDEYFFLDAYGAAVVEHLIAATGARLCAWAARRDLAVLPHDSPGYAGWNVGEQAKLLELLEATRGGLGWPGGLEALDSGALRPTKSQLAVFGLTRHADRLDGRVGTIPCVGCPLDPCAYRRAPYGMGCRRGTTPAFGAGDELRA
jgi:hypothetical protein